MTFTGPHDATNPGKVPKVAQVFWSRKRCYHGEEVTLSLRTENVPDGTAVELTISGKDGGTVDTVGGLQIAKSAVDHKYKIDWKNKALPDTREFVFKAKVDKLLSGDSPVLFLDLGPPGMSA
jgi:hypothetical protein